MARRPVVVVLAAVALVGAVGLAACADDAEAEACGPLVVEQLHPDQGHLLGEATRPTYLTDPPTSGPHTPGLAVTGAVDRPLDPVEQVSTLEEGTVILQYRDPDDGTTLRRLAGPGVVVAPAPDLAAPVVATAWARKMTCEAIDVDALSRFVEEAGGLSTGHATSTTASDSTTSTTSTTSTSTNTAGP